MSRARALPEAEQNILRDLRTKGDLPVLRARVALLRDAGWTLAAIGAPLEANRSTTRMWEYAADNEFIEQAKQLGAVPEIDRAPQGAREIRKFPDVPVEDREKLRTLANGARAVRGWTADDAPSMIAAKELERMLVRYSGQGVPLKRLAEHMGVTHRAVAARIERAQKTEVPA